jgi:gas vesicle protein
VAQERHDVAFVVGAVLGGLGGAVATLFTAPQSGQRTRDQLAGHANAVGQRISAGSSTLQLRGQQLSERATGAINSVAGRDDATMSAVAGTDAGVFTLPDPLEPDPIIETGTGAPDIAPVALNAAAVDLARTNLETNPGIFRESVDRDSRGSGL